MNPHYRHGDLLITRIDAIPERAELQPAKGNRRLVLAEGEVTGHLHEVPSDHAALYTGDVLASDEAVAELREMWLLVAEPSPLTHPEHDTISLPAGSYVVTRQREYSPEAIRRVAD